MLCLATSLEAKAAQPDTITVVSAPKAVHLRSNVEAGQYSGIVRMADDTYAVVSDDDEGNAYHLWRIGIDSLNSRVTHVEAVGKWGDGGTDRRDMEGIAYMPHTGTLLISGEAHHDIVEVRQDGTATGRRIVMPDSIAGAIATNRSLEALCYDTCTHTVWTATESTIALDGTPSSATNGIASVCRLMAFNDNMNHTRWLRYVCDNPSKQSPAKFFAMGISGMEALGDGRLLVLEREARVNRRIIGSYTITRLYVVNPAECVADGDTLRKTLVWQCKTRLSFRRRWANYEGIAITPQHSDGSRTVILLSDSQRRYRGVLRDWIATIRIR